ncbi:hypothetical protein GCM10009775_33970 [Microbacterium aoyamense]|uniref:Uncharacterized protein n=1 Tax=Microbacterium aoyamense TaxID=344166 RepID=A0ABN2Q1V9_9MICO|nr:hypothetical protein [Microbacterium aoyamense]
MATPELAPRRTIGGLVIVWVAALVIGTVVGIFVPSEGRAAWLTVGMGLCVILSFGVQLWSGRSQGFTRRVAASALGALFVLGIISLGFGLASLTPA